MNINHNLFYRDLVDEEHKVCLYNWSLDMVALITGIIKVSGGRLAVARVEKPNFMAHCPRRLLDHHDGASEHSRAYDKFL